MALQRMKGQDIKDGSVTHEDIANKTIIADNIQDGIITDNQIAANANINPSKIDWTNFNTGSLSLPPGLYFQNFDLLSIGSGGLWGLVASNSLEIISGYGIVSNFYLPFPLTFNYLEYIINQSGSSNRKVIWGIYNSNGNLIYQSGQQSVTSGSYKIPGSGKTLQPGVYYYLVYANDTTFTFVASTGTSPSLIPRTGFYPCSSLTLPGQLNFSNISYYNVKQPWMAISQL